MKIPYNSAYVQKKNFKFHLRPASMSTDDIARTTLDNADNNHNSDVYSLSI